MAPPRSLLHVPPLLLHAPHRHSMGHSLHDVSRGNSTAHAPVRLCALPGCVAAGGDGGVFFGGQAAGTGHSGIAGQEEATRVVYAGRGGGTVGVWILF